MGRMGIILNAIVADKKKTLLLIFAILVISLFVMNFISLPLLLLDRQLVFASDVSIASMIFLVLFPMLATIAILVQKSNFAKNSHATLFGGLLGTGASACPICQSLVFTIIGLVGFPISYEALPLKGEEFKIFSIVFLVLAIYLGTNEKEKCKDCVKQN